MTAFGGGAFPPGIPAGGGGGGSRPSGMVLTRPRIADFTTLGNGTVSDVDAGVLFSVPDSASTFANTTSIVQAKPGSTPWTLYAQWSVPFPDYAGGMHFAVNESSTGKYVSFGTYVESSARVYWNYSTWASLTSRSSSTGADVPLAGNAFFSLSHTAANNFEFRMSLSGVVGSYVLLHSVSTTSHLSTYDRVGLLSWSFDDVVSENSTPVVTHWSTSPPTWVVGAV